MAYIVDRIFTKNIQLNMSKKLKKWLYVLLYQQHNATYTPAQQVACCTQHVARPCKLLLRNVAMV